MQDYKKFIDLSGDFFANGKNLTSLIGCENLKINTIFISRNPNLHSLKGLPKKINHDLYCTQGGSLTLEGIGKDYLCEMNGDLDFTDTKIISHILGVLKIKGLNKIFLPNKKLEDILNRHLLGDRDIIQCADELIENGFKDYARL